MSYVIIGNSYAAFGAIEAIRAIDQRQKIVVISDEPHHCYARPLISFWLGGTVTSENMYYRGADFYKRHNIELRLDCSAVSLDVRAQEVVLENGARVKYEKLLIATGSVPFVPSIEGLTENTKNVHTFTRWQDAMALKELARQGSRAVVVGGGLIGVKAAEGLNDAGVDVTIVELGPRVLSLALDEVAGDIVSHRLVGNGIKIITGTTVDVVITDDDERVSGVVLQNGRRLDCEILVIAIGVRPNASLAAKGGIAVEKGVITDETMRTSDPSIYAAGDVAQNINLINGNQAVLAIVPVAYEQGRVAGRNMAGVRCEYKGAIPINSADIYGVPVMSMGVTTAPDDSYTEVAWVGEGRYRKYVFNGDVLAGVLLVGDVVHAGVLTNLIACKKLLTNKAKETLTSGRWLSLSPGVGGVSV